MRTKNKVIFAAAGCLAFAASTPLTVSAQDQSITNFKECLKIENNDLRLHCYDTIAKSGIYYKEAQKQESKRIKAEKEKARVDSYGFNGKQKKKLSTKASKQDVSKKKKPSLALETNKDSIEVKVVDLLAGPAGVYYAFLENGQVWKLSGNGRRKPFKVPYQVTIMPGAMGSYFMKLSKSGKKIRTKRIR